MLLLLFIVLPMVELWLLFRVGAVLGGGATLALIVLTGVAGATLARRQGLAVFQRMQTELQQGRQPTATMLEGFAILLAGIVLMTPGLITDALGLLLLVPPTRRAILASFVRAFERSVKSGRTRVHVRMGGRPPPPDGAPPQPGATSFAPGPVKDVGYVDVTPDRPGGPDDDTERPPAGD